MNADDALLDMRRRAVALAERLIEGDARTLAAEMKLRHLEMQIEAGGASGGEAAAPAGFVAPALRHPWPLADNPDAGSDDLGFYERRPDDPAILEAHAGAAFLRRFDLTGEDAAFDAAAAELRASGNRLPQPAPGAAPEVSVVMPIHGQLGYTLNGLAALFAHATRHSVEVIVVDDASPDRSGAVLAELAGVAGLSVLPLTRNLGFLGACNAGAATARGRILVLLNNDTRVVAGWLDALVDSFARFPQAGLVGSKLLYPDGVLQEAGGIIWRDGSAWNYGREDDPNRPHYCHARQVDYVSGASVALPRALWRELGGFDAHFAPAYGEDSDLGLRVRAAGREVWFQPLSRVIHYEGRTGGTDLGSGVKTHQITNRKKLLLRWREELSGRRRNGEAVYFERERGVRKRALIVDATNPTPKQDAGSVTTTLTLRLFQELGYKMHFVPQDNFLFEPGPVGDLQRIGVECAYAPYDVGFEDYIARHGALFDVVLVYRVTVLHHVLADLRRHAPQAAVLFHNMDLHFLRMERAAGHEADPADRDVALVAAAEMKERELALIGEVDCTITHSTYERALIAAELPEAPVVVWPFMFEFFGTAARFAQRRDFCFLGGYRHGPNVDAVEYFVAEILPVIRRTLPDARFIIAGANPGPGVLVLAGPNVVVTGMIDDLRDVFDRVRVFACCLRIGAGTKGKVSTAMAYGLPVVSTACGAEGMDMVEGEEVLIADDPAAFAAACVRAHEDAALWERLSQAGQRLVREKHSLDMGRRVLAAAIETAFTHRLGLDGSPSPPAAAR